MRAHRLWASRLLVRKSLELRFNPFRDRLVLGSNFASLDPRALYSLFRVHYRAVAGGIHSGFLQHERLDQSWNVEQLQLT